jgi:hypothetical protein
MALTLGFLTIPAALLAMSRRKDLQRIGYLVLVRSVIGPLFFAFGFLRGLWEMLLYGRINPSRDS